MDPYVCVFDNCDTPLEIYSSSREWLAHMRTRHRMRWHCFATSHEAAYFESPDLLESHLRRSHAKHFSDDDISILIENSGHPITPVIGHCPFCQEPSDYVEEHVAQHLLQFALRSLPWPEDGYEGSQRSQSLRSSSSSSDAGTRETNKDVDTMPDVRQTDWSAWEDHIPEDMKHPRDLIRNLQYQRPFLTGGEAGLVRPDEFMVREYDAAEDELLEPFRKRDFVVTTALTPSETKFSERKKTLENFFSAEEVFVWNLHVLNEIYKGSAEACPKLDRRTVELLFRNLADLITLHKGFLDKLKDSHYESDLIGEVFLESIRKVGPAHETYYSKHDEALLLWNRIRQE